MLMDAYLPEYDVRERHTTRVHASMEDTYAAIREADLARSTLVKALLSMRALPGALRHGRRGLTELRRQGVNRVTLASFEARGFRILEESPPSELVIGLEGKFWLPTGDIDTPPAEAFRSAAPAAGCARAVWNFTVVTTSHSAVELATETRVLCADAATRRRFLPYWYLIRAGSGLIRHAMLRAIRSTAEQRANPEAMERRMVGLESTSRGG